MHDIPSQSYPPSHVIVSLHLRPNIRSVMSSSSAVNVHIVSPDTRSTRRFDLHLTVADLKSKLELVTGISSTSQQIVLYSSEEDADLSRNPIAVLNEEGRPLGFYSLCDGLVLKVRVFFVVNWKLSH